MESYRAQMAVSLARLKIPCQLSRYSSRFRHSNKICVRTLTSHSPLSALNNLLHCNNRDGFRRNYGDWAPNVVKSPYPDFDVPNQLFHEFFWSRQEQWADLTALVCGLTGREMKYRELRRACGQVARSLLKSGLRPGEVVSAVLPNTIEFPATALGVLEAGLVLSTINPAYTPDEIAYQLQNSSSVAVFTIPEKLEAVLKAKELVGKENKELASKLRVICTPDVLGREQPIPPGVERYSDLLECSVVEEGALSSSDQGGGSGVQRSASDVAFIPYSSGTTGRPKGVCLTHSNLICPLLALRQYRDLEEASNDKQEIVPCILPAFHIYGFSVVMGFSLFCGGKLVILPKFEEQSFLRVLSHYKPTVLYVAPPLIVYIGNSPNVTKDHLKSLKLIVSGAAPCAQSDINKCIEKSPSSLVYKQGFGLTETSPIVCLTGKNIHKYDSVGSPVSRTKVKVADLQTGQALGPNEEGEIHVKGPQVMAGYLNNEKANTEVLDSEGWFRTGDIGYYDKDKDFYITDRLKELIKVKGFQVAPAELEAVLRSHPDVEDAGVVGVPHPRKGESPIGFVKTKAGSSPSVQELKTFLAEKVASFKCIDTFVFVDSIPKSAAGKILRKDLKANYLKNNSNP